MSPAEQRSTRSLRPRALSSAAADTPRDRAPDDAAMKAARAPSGEPGRRPNQRYRPTSACGLTIRFRVARAAAPGRSGGHLSISAQPRRGVRTNAF